MKKGFKVIGFSLLGLLALMLGYMVTQGVYPIWMSIHDKVYQVENDLAIGGMDPVTYFAGNPEMGNSNHSYRYKGASFQFASAQNLEAFKANPDNYMPKYGGYCAFATGSGVIAPSSAECYLVQEGELFLFSNKEVQIKFKESFSDMKQKADKAWKK